MENEKIGKHTYCQPVCNILAGFGGAQFFEGTKLSRYPAGSGLLRFCDSVNELEELYDKMNAILESFGKPKREWLDKDQIDKLNQRAGWM